MAAPAAAAAVAAAAAASAAEALLNPTSQPPPDRRVSRATAEARIANLRRALGLPASYTGPVKIVGIGAGAWGAVFVAMLQDMYREHGDLVELKIWRRHGKIVSKQVISDLLGVIHQREDVLRRLRNDAVYLKYVAGRLGDRKLTADELLSDGFCLNLPTCPLSPMKVVTDLDEAVFDAHILINALPSTETRSVFEQIGRVWNATRNGDHHHAVIISLSKGVETSLEPYPHIITPTRIIQDVTRTKLEKLLYLGGPNIASEVWRGEYATARICGISKPLRQALAAFCSNNNFVLWENRDIITHEVLGGLKNVYAVGQGIVTAATNDSATSKAVYFSNAAAEMVFITRLLAKNPEELQGPLLADTYVTLLKGRNSWYGFQIGSGKLHPRDGDDIPGKGLIQGVSAVFAFHALLSDERVRIWDRSLNREVCPIEVLPTLRSLHAILSYKGDDMTAASQAFVAKLKDSSAQDPARRLRTANLYQAQLTQLPGEEDWLDLEDSEEITIEPVTAETRSRTTSVQDDGPRTPGLGSM